MSKPKAKTGLERRGFRDPDLRTNKHDDLVAWTEDRCYCVTSFADFVRLFYPDIKKGEKIQTRELSSLYHFCVDNNVEHFSLANCVWEEPVMDRSYLIGYVDLVLWFKLESRKLAYPYYLPIACEIKSTEVSMGELMRQIRSYKAYWKNNTMHQLMNRKFDIHGGINGDLVPLSGSAVDSLPFWCVVSPGCSYVTRLRTQGIEYIPYTGKPEEKKGSTHDVPGNA